MTTDNPLLSAALDYAARGWRVFPIVPMAKNPAIREGHLRATVDEKTIKRWWRGPDRENRNVAIVTSLASDLIVIDCDIDKTTGELGEDTLSALVRDHGPLPEGPIAETPTGGLHYYFRWPEDGSDFPRRIKVGPGLDFLGGRMVEGQLKAGYVIAPPSVREDGFYKWRVYPKDIAPAYTQKWLINLATESASKRPEDMPKYQPENTGLTTPYGRKALEELCSEISSAPPGQQDVTLITKATRIGSLSAGNQIARIEAWQATVNAAMQMQNQAGRERWTQASVEKKIARAFEYGSRDPYRPRPTGRGESRSATGAKALAASSPAQAENKEKAEEKQEGPRLVSNNDSPRDWRDGLDWVCKDDGTLAKNSIKNFQLMIEHHPKTREMFRHNTFTDRVEVHRGLPGYETGNYPRELNDHDEVAMAAWLNNRGLSGTISTVASVIREIAYRAQYDPLRDYLLNLTWDGERRLDTWLTKYCGSPDSAYTRIVGRKFMISAAARALQPGCKCDAMMILEGKQAIGKSTLGFVMAGPGWFTDQVGDVTSKDSSERLQGAWIVEIPEMDKFNRAEANAVKDFLSRREDRYRPAYGRNVVNRPRRCVFLGTINPDGSGYLRDTTGNRRFWPVECNGRINVPLLESKRDQLWAEAVIAFQDGEEWWIHESDEDLISKEQDTRRDEDIWEPVIDKWLDDPLTPEYFTTHACLFEAVSVPVAHQTHQQKIRLSKILQVLGCVKAMNTGGIRGRCWHNPRKGLKYE